MNRKRAIAVVDLAYGDCGKGHVVDFLAREMPRPAIIRFNGGPQAGHNVVTPDGRHHTFAQFGSGTFVPKTQTLLSRFMLIEPYALFNEAANLEQLGQRDCLDRLIIDGRCPVITPAHQAANRIRELSRGPAAHGTCGMGIGETMRDLIENPGIMLHAVDLQHREKVAQKLQQAFDRKADELRDACRALGDHPQARSSIQTLHDQSWIEVAVDTYAELAHRAAIVSSQEFIDGMDQAQTLIFEGAQGVLLDEEFGFAPHTTWSNTTTANAQTLLNEAGMAIEMTCIGVLRSYFSRHGAGPFVTEDPRLSPLLPELHNSDSSWQGNFRVGTFDAVAARYALNCLGRVDGLAITHLDRLGDLPPKICTAYLHGESNGTIDSLESLLANRPEDITKMLNECRAIFADVNPNTEQAFLDAIARELQTPVVLTSHGPAAADMRWITSEASSRLRH